MAKPLQLDADLASLLAPLLRNLVTYRPHHNRRVIAVIEHEVSNILLSPLAEEAGIAVLAFRIEPHVERLGHHHHTHRVANLHLHG